ncbi:MAG: hypothetical protein IPL47_17350 [Phyllobacteriaceae bacterium]|nr:hypothetical protein [Phyllobacteriaceae bacterium]
MVRDEYTFGACQKGGHTVDSVLGHSSSRDPATTPLDKRWIAEWSRFFKVCGQVGPVGKPQYSKKIRPSIAMGLDSTVAAEGGDGLAWRDLVRSAISGVVKTRTLADWFAKAIAQELPPGTMPDIISALGKIDTHPMPELGLWAATEFFDDGYKKMPSNLVDKLLEDPPLGLYVLIEASVFENGDRLGPLGSLIVAETFFRSLLDAEKTLAEQAAGLDNPTDPKTLADAIFTCAPKSMSAFLTWIDGRLPPSEKTAPHGEGTSVGLPFI